METIHKYPLKVKDVQLIEMPAHAEILCVQIQIGIPCLWAKVNPNYGTESRAIYIHGTGHTCDPRAKKYIGTFQLSGGTLVFHVFEE